MTGSGTHAVGIDVGTTNAKVALVDADGMLVAAAARPIRTARDGDRAEQDPAELWAAVAGAVQEVTAAAPAAAAGVAHVGIDSQYSSTMPVDASGAAVGPVIMWLDQRGTDRCFAIMERDPDSFMTFLEHHGIPPVGGGLSLSHILYLQHECPEIHAATTAYLEVMEFVAAQLTGVIAGNQCTQFTSQLVDNRTLGATEYDPALVAASGVDVAKMPPLRPPTEAVGTLRPDVAAELGLPATAVVQATINDSHAGAIATGARRPDRIGLMIGTTSVMLDTTDRHGTDLDHEVLSMPSPFPGEYLVWAENGLGGKVVEHMLEKVVHASDELGDHSTADQFAQLDELLANVPPGSGGALFLPWLNGSLSPTADPNMRGGFLNLSLDTERRHLVRAVVEGVGFNLGWLLPIVETFSGHRDQTVVFGGGAARSREWVQTLADIFDRPVAAVRDPHQMIARATALFALVQGGVITDADLDQLVAVAGVVEPRAEHRATYARMQEQFVAAFDALRPISAALNA
ncbi:MAG: xylulokinase [Acidimicrobiia bacterium]